MTRLIVHILFPNGAKQAPFSVVTYCGTPVDDRTAAYWDGDRRQSNEKWCSFCRMGLRDLEQQDKLRQVSS